MEFQIKYCKNNIKNIEAKDLDEAEKKAPKSWTEILMLNRRMEWITPKKK